MRPPQQFNAGDLLSVVADDGLFGIVKVLALDSQGIHIRLYQQRFAQRPLAVEPESLTLGSLFASDAPFSIGHIPLSHAAFRGWQARQVAPGTVADSELEGYRGWLEAGGGYF